MEFKPLQSTSLKWSFTSEQLVVIVLATNRIQYQEGAKANNAQEREKDRAAKGEGGLRGGCRGGEGRRRRRKGKKGGSIGERNRRREGISRARAIPGKGSTREKRRQGKARNSKKTHYSSLGNCLSNTR